MTMTLFKFKDQLPNAQYLDLSDGETISDYTSLMWIERYRNFGEFTIVAPVSSGLRTKLPLGSLISHTGTEELMIVENHEIDEDVDGKSTIKVTGRSFETFLENRIVTYYGGNADAARTPPGVIQTFYFPTASTPSQHAVRLINFHTYRNPVANLADISNLRTISTVSLATGASTTRELKITDLHKSLLELLAIDDLGIRSVRPGNAISYGYDDYATLIYTNPGDFGFVIHEGIDQSGKVSFSNAAGELQNAKYLWSLKNKRTVVHVKGTTIRTPRYSDFDAKGYDFRAGYVDATDIKSPVTDELTALYSRGDAYLGEMKDITIVSVSIAPNTSRFKYREDYNVGDKVSVFGNYNSDHVMRVTEHVEIIDETGTSSYPTLEAI